MEAEATRTARRRSGMAAKNLAATCYADGAEELRVAARLPIFTQYKILVRLGAAHRPAPAWPGAS